jgi:small subunit ribosomal protein S17
MADQTTTTSETAGREATRVTRIGVVSSDARDKTIAVLCSFAVPHPKYGKLLSRRTKVHAHDEQNEAKRGDRVEIAECRPYSKQKHWRLVRVVERAALEAGT